MPGGISSKKGSFLQNRLWFAVFPAILMAFWLAKPAPEAPVSASAQPLSGRIICLDAGHGGYDGGARGASGVWEKELNLQVAVKTRAALEAMGARVVMTRTRDTDLAEASREGATKKRRDMNARLQTARQENCQLLLSLHMNEYRSPASSGPQVFYTRGQEDSRLLAGCLQESLIRTLQPPKERAALAGDYYILKLPIPSCLVECGFISNPEEEKKLRDPAYQQLLAQAVARGTAAYFELQSRRDMLQ